MFVKSQNEINILLCLKLTIKAAEQVKIVKRN